MIITDLTVTALSSYYIEYWCQRILRNNALCFFRLRAPKCNPGQICHHPSWLRTFSGRIHEETVSHHCVWWPVSILTAAENIQKLSPRSTVAKPNNKPFPILPRMDCKFHPQLVGLWQPGWNPQRNLISTPDQPGSQVAFKGGLDLTLSVIAWDDDSHNVPVRKPTDQVGS